MRNASTCVQHTHTYYRCILSTTRLQRQHGCVPHSLSQSSSLACCSACQAASFGGQPRVVLYERLEWTTTNKVAFCPLCVHYVYVAGLCPTTRVRPDCAGSQTEQARTERGLTTSGAGADNCRNGYWRRPVTDALRASAKLVPRLLQHLSSCVVTLAAQCTSQARVHSTQHTYYRCFLPTTRLQRQHGCVPQPQPSSSLACCSACQAASFGGL
jgi:hypothetical protein